MRKVSSGDFSGVEDAAFFRYGGLAYSCAGGLRISDGKGDRELEPAGSQVLHLAVWGNNRGFGPRLYWTAGATLKTLEL